MDEGPAQPTHLRFEEMVAKQEQKFGAMDGRQAAASGAAHLHANGWSNLSSWHPRMRARAWNDSTSTTALADGADRLGSPAARADLPDELWRVVWCYVSFGISASQHRLEILTRHVCHPVPETVGPTCHR